MKILTFDIEEWFHILDNSSTKTHNEWVNFEVRIHENTERILTFLIENKLKATFFVLGWIAEQYPDVVKKIHDCGFEIGSHTHMHQLMYNQSRTEVAEDLKKSIDVLENITSKKISCFRAPGFSITEKNKWVFDILYENGIRKDSSIFPATRAHGGFPSFNHNVPAVLKFNGVELKEFPINTVNLFGKKIIFSGGGYFRVSPYLFIKYWSKNTSYVMTYFHPRDFDPNQPVISDLSLSRKFKSYVGLKTSINKLSKWTKDFSFIDLNTADKIINWDDSPKLFL